MRQQFQRGSTGERAASGAKAVRTRAQSAWSRARGDESGQGLVEYVLVIAIVSLGAVIALGFLSGKINNVFSKSGNSINNITVAQGGGGGGGGTPPADGTSMGTVATKTNISSTDVWKNAPMYQCNTSDVNGVCTAWAAMSLPQGGAVFNPSSNPTGACSFTLPNGFSYSGTWKVPAGDKPVGANNDYNSGATGGGTIYNRACF